MNRRQILIGITAAGALGLSATASRAELAKITVEDAHAAAGRDELFLIDVRTRWEWKKTGVGATAPCDFYA